MNPFYSPVGFGVYGNESTKFRGSMPIRLVHAKAGIETVSEKAPEKKKYSFEAGLTPLMLFAVVGGLFGLVYLWKKL
jgi:hypothetical protein